jgi:hypothetical protein
MYIFAVLTLFNVPSFASVGRVRGEPSVGTACVLGLTPAVMPSKVTFMDGETAADAVDTAINTALITKQNCVARIPFLLQNSPKKYRY